MAFGSTRRAGAFTQRRFQKISDFQPASALKSLHMLVCHHGELEFKHAPVVFLIPYELIPEGPL